MALTCNGTTQGAQSASALAALAGVTRLSVVYWINTTFSNDDDILLELSANSNTTAGAFKVIAAESGTTTFWMDWNSATATKALTHCPPPSNSTWHRVVMEFDMSLAAAAEPVAIYVDGVAQTLTSTPAENTGGLTSQTLYVMCRGAASLFADGSIADLALFGGSTVLSAGEVTALQTGRADTIGRGADLLYHWKLSGDLTANVGGINLTGVASPTFTADPPALVSSSDSPTLWVPGFLVPQPTVGMFAGPWSYPQFAGTDDVASAKSADATQAITATGTAAGTTAKPVDAAQAVTATGSAAGVVTRFGAATQTATATGVSAATVAKPVDAAQTVTATQAAAMAGSAKPVDAAQSVTAAGAAVGTSAKPVNAAQTATATGTAAAVTAKPVDAAQTVTATQAAAATVTSAGVKSADAAQALTATSTAAATVAKPAAAAQTVTATGAGAVTVTKPVAAVQTVTVTQAATATVVSGSVGSGLRIGGGLKAPVYLADGRRAVIRLADGRRLP